MNSPETSFIAAMRAAALADAGVKAMLGDPARIHDARPADPIYPFATLGRVETRPSGAGVGAALEHSVNLHVWSRYGGKSEAIEAVAALRSALDDRPLSIPGRRVVYVFATYTDVFAGQDGRTTQGVLRLRAVTEPL